MEPEVERRQGGTLTDAERRKILKRLHATLSWVGVRIPEECMLDGERISLRDRVDRFVFDDFIDEDERAEVRDLIDKLEERGDILVEELEVEDMTMEEAETLLARTIGLFRAVDELKHLEDKDEWADRRTAIMEKVEDANRWREFTHKVYHTDEYY